MPVRELFAVSDSSARTSDFTKFRNRFRGAAKCPSGGLRWLVGIPVAAGCYAISAEADEVGEAQNIIRMVRHADDVYEDLNFSAETAKFAENNLPPVQPMNGYVRAARR